MLWFLLGLTSANLPPYLFLSGIGSILIPPILNVGGFALLWAWRNQCLIHGCHWPTKHRTAAGDLACWKHRPHKPGKTIEELRRDHHLYLGRQIGDG